MAEENKPEAEKKQRLQWHPAFAAALEMELKDNRGDLYFDSEHNLNRKPLIIDCLVIKVKENAVIKNEIGKFFRHYNVIEYKSAKASMSIDDIAKTQGYASLFKSYGKRINEIKYDEVAVTLIRESKPEVLFKYLAENSYTVSNPNNGIYYVESGLQFPTQIIVGRELDRENHEWFNLLSNKVTKQEMVRVIEYSRNISDKKERELIDAVLDVSVAANRDIVEEIKRGDENMCQALMEIMKPEIDEVVNNAVKKARIDERNETTERVERETAERVTERAIKVAVEMLRNLNLGNDEIKKALQKNYNLSEEEALSYLE